jgi:dephospho-CoA kinase
VRHTHASELPEAFRPPADDVSASRPVRRIALTGGIATGKSHVRALFEELGIPTIDSDRLAREAVAPGSAGLAAVVGRFGPEVLDASGALDRRKLAKIVFADAEARRALEQIIHPEIRRATDAWFASLESARHPYAIADVPLLYEVERDRDFDRAVVVACDPSTQIRRLMERDHLSDGEARQRVAAQLPIEDKIRRADYVIRTDGSLADTARQVKEVWTALSADGG